MTDEEMRVAIAEACGEVVESWNGKPRLKALTPHGVSRDLPDYPNDLNAMHEAEKILTFEQWRHYSDKLMCAVRDSDLTLNGSNIEARYKTPHATARQRAEAFLKVFGLWKD